MKSKVYLIIAIIILSISCNSCRSINGNLFVNYSAMFENVYWRINDFYDAYLRFPRNIDELNDFIWQIINAENDSKYLSPESFPESDSTIATHDLVTVKFLEREKDKIKMICEENRLFLTYKHERIEIEKNICEDLERPLENSHFIHSLNICEIFDFDGRIMRNYYNNDFSELLKSIKKKYLHKYPNAVIDTIKYSAFRYDKNNGLSKLCPSLAASDINNNLYLEELSLSLDTFIDKRNIDVIQFIIGVPNGY